MKQTEKRLLRALQDSKNIPGATIKRQVGNKNFKEKFFEKLLSLNSLPRSDFHTVEYTLIHDIT